MNVNVVRMLSRALCVPAVLLVWAVPVRAETGRLYVKSEPRGAKVYLDDETEPRAKTPCFLKDLEPGIHVLRASLDGYADIVEEVEVTEGKMARATLEFISEAAAGDTEGGDEAGPARRSGPLRGADDAAAMDALPDESDGAAGGDPAGTEGPSSAGRDDKPPKYTEVDCHVCGGTGLLQQTACPACAGTGYSAGQRCGECGGKCRAEHKCAACKGEGTIVVRGQQGTCARCKGKGKMPCLPCRGTGKLKRPNPAASHKPTSPCPHCTGTGFENEARCTACSGKGTLVSGEGARIGVRGGAATRVVVRFDCPFCGGDGMGPPMCRTCRGLGLVGSDKARVTCPACIGTGRAYHPCRACAGRGWVAPK